jgi:hypothetical protein
VNLSVAWIAPLAVGGAAAAALAVVAARLRREVAALQRSLRPLRVKAPSRK